MLQGNPMLLVPVFFPMFAGLIFYVLGLREEKTKRAYISLTLVLNSLLVFFLLAGYRGSEFILFYITETLPILFRVDGITIFYAALVAVIWLGATLYSFAYIDHDPYDKRYYAFLTALLGAMMGIAFAGNIITYYLFYEMMTFMSFPLIGHSMKKEDIKAAVVFLIYSIFGATLVLIGFAFLNGYGDLSHFVPGGSLDGAAMLANPRLLLIASFLMIVGFGCKAGMFPLHAWLPVAHPAAPAPFSGILSALITKAGVIGIVRVLYYVVGVGPLRGTWVQTVWMSFALITVFMGSMLAYREPVLKRRLAFSSNSQISYLLFGLSVMTPNGLIAGLLQLCYHAFAKTILFLCAGVFIHNAGITEVSKLEGMGKKMPIVMGCFTIASLSLIGIPPLGGFVSKWHLITASLEAPLGFFSYLGPILLLLSALLTAGYLLPIVIQAFFPSSDVKESPKEFHEPGWLMKGPLVGLVVLSVLYAVFSYRLLNLFATVIAKIG